MNALTEFSVALGASDPGTIALDPGDLDLWLLWAPAPLMLGAMAATGGAGLVAARGDRRRLTALIGAGLAMAAAFAGPLGALSGALHAARMGQFLLLALVAAPLLTRALGLRALGLHPAPGAAAFAAAAWLWTAPGAYAAAMEHPWLHATLQLALLGSATLLWAGLAGARRDQVGSGAGAAMASAGQLALLGAMLFGASEPWYEFPAFAAAGALGLDPLLDQRLAGVMLAGLGGGALGFAAWRLVGAWLRRVETVGI